MSDILFIEDDEQIARIVRMELEEAGWSVNWASQGVPALQSLRWKEFKLVLLDLNLPDIDGLELCEKIRASNAAVAILILSARAGKRDVVRGLELGADDYVTKPFDTLELIARVRVLLRRAAREGTIPPVEELLVRGRLSIGLTTREVRVDGKLIELTAKEFDLLLLFAQHPGRPFTRNELLTRVWGEGFEGYEHTVNTHINRLRNKVERDSKKPTLVVTVWGVGYRLVGQAPG